MTERQKPDAEEHADNALLALTEIAEALHVTRPTVSKWHSAPVSSKTKTASPLQAVAEAMEVEVPEAFGPRPRYPWKVVVAFAKATGYMDDKGMLVPEIMEKGRGRWRPVEPTVDPGEGNRRRFYVNHAAAVLTIKESTLEQLRNRSDSFPPEDGFDELARPYWWLETLQTRIRNVQEWKERRGAGPEPDGYLENGQPYWTGGPDNFWVRRWKGLIEEEEN